MGHVDGPDAMALAFLNSAGVYQMVGYTVPTWYGYGGWGMLDYFLEQPGRFTLSEAFFANQQALIHRLVTSFPEEAALTTAGRLPRDKELPPAARSAGLTWHDAEGLLYDRDTLALYGDPAWQTRMAQEAGPPQSDAIPADLVRNDLKADPQILMQNTPMPPAGSPSISQPHRV
jgi:hypothetical protein